MKHYLIKEFPFIIIIDIILENAIIISNKVILSKRYLNLSWENMCKNYHKNYRYYKVGNYYLYFD